MVVSVFASRENPQRVGRYIETVTNDGRRCYRVTDRNGKFWTVDVNSAGIVKSQPKIRVWFSKRQNDLMVDFPEGFHTSSDGRFVIGKFSSDFVQQLTDRGYDIETIRFSVECRKGSLRFAGTRPDGMTAEEAWNKLRQDSGAVDE